MKKLIFVVFAALHLNTNAQVCFSSPKQASTNFSTGPVALTCGDFNNDGNPDLMSANFNNGSVTLLVGSGNAQFNMMGNFTAGTQPAGIANGDFNHDGNLDFVVVNSGSNDFSIGIGNGSGGFSVTTNAITIGNNPQWVATADLNNDNQLDLVFSPHNSSQITVVMGLGGGSFGGINTYTLNGSPSGLSLADFDTDGKLDVAVGLGGIGFDLLIGNGNGTFGPATTFGGGTVYEIATADFNGDGKLDVAGSQKLGVGVAVFLGNGAGSFGTATTYTTLNDANCVAAGDFNNDGKQDVCVSHECPTASATILLGDGTGALGATNTVQGPGMLQCPKKIISADFNGDGKMDIAVADKTGNNVVGQVQLLPIAIGSTASSNVICYGKSVTLNGTGGVSYTWSNGVSDGVTFTPTATATYSVTGTDINNCTNNDTITVTVLSLPNVTANATATLICNGQQVTLSGGGAATYTWTSGVSNGIAFTPTANATYTVTGTAANTCTNTASVTVNVRPIPPAPEICEVTADSLSINNLIYWDKTLYQNADTFLIYRDTANYNYALIGKVPYDSLSMYADTARHVCPTVSGDPKTTFYKYKLAYKDSCGTMSPMSPYHQSVYMYTSGGGLFQWNHYEIEGQPVPVPGLSQYRLMRDNFATGSYTLAAGASASSNLISDPQYNTYQNTADWRIETQWSIICTPTLRQGNNNTMGSIVKTRSNVKNNRTMGIKTTERQFALYPNPATDLLTVELNSSGNYTLQIINISGKVVLSQNINNNTKVDVKDLPAGVYTVNLVAKENISRKQLVIIR
ncbi:MAG: FG-GAP-like repeat-containing protein [Bacteroidia bacterium]